MVIEKNRLGEELLSDGELLDIIYNWMGRIISSSDWKDNKELAEDILKFLRD